MFDSMAVQKILKEDTTATTEVSEEDVTIYAEQLGIDVSKEKHLLWIARKGLETPVPVPWCPVEDEKGRIYYYNHATDKSTWEHPADDHFRKLVKQERDKHIANKEDTELGIESELSSLDDVPPITSGKSSTSAQVDENNLKIVGRRMGSLCKMHELGKEEKYASASYLKRSVIEDKFDSRSFIDDINSLGKRSNYSDPLIKVTDDNSLILNHSTDDDLSTGLDGIGFDRFAEQYGIMDASRLSPVMPSSQVGKGHSYIKQTSQPMPKNLLKTLFNTSNELDQSFSEARKDEDLSFADFLKEAEEYSNIIKDKSQAESNLEEKSIEDNCTKNASNSSEANISVKEDSEQEEIQNSPKQLDSLASNNEKFKHDILDIGDCWKRKLEGKEKEIRLDYEKHIAELQEKLAEEKTIEEIKLKDSILLMKEENAVILAKQEQVLTEELEADLESAKEKLEMKKFATLQEIQDQEEKYATELEEKRIDARQIFESKVQNLYLEMEKKLEEKKQDIQCNHQQEIDDLTKEHAEHLEVLKKSFQLTDGQELSKEIDALKEELISIKEQVETEKQALEQLQKKELELEERKVQLSGLLQEEEMIKHNNEEERDKLLQEKYNLQNQVSKLKSELTEQNQTMQCLTTNKSVLETEIMLIEEELNKQKSLLQQTKELPTITFIDKCTDTYDLLLIDDNISEKEKPECDDETSFNYEPEKESENEDDHIACCDADKNEKTSLEEDKIERLEIKIGALEKAFRLLEIKIGNTVDSALLHDHESHPINNKIPKADEKCECYNKTIHTNFTSGIANNMQQLFNSEDLKSTPYLQNASNNKYSVFCVPNKAKDTHPYENNLVYSVYSKDMCQQEMDLALSPVYISESDTELFPFSRSDTAIQLEHCKEKFRNLQAKHETSRLNLELIKKEIFNNMSRKDTDNNNEIQNLSYQQIPNHLYGAPELESQYTENMLPGSALTNVITFPTNRAVQNDEWHSPLWQNSQKLIQKEHQLKDKPYPSYVMVEEKENDPLDQFFTLTETVLDKELELFSKDKIEKQYLSYPTLNERNSSNKFINSESFDKSKDSHTKNISYSGLSTNYKPMYIHQPTLVGELITEKEDWMEKIGSMYQKIRAYERDLVLKRSLKTNY